jgi:protein-disulfide isomerase
MRLLSRLILVAGLLFCSFNLPAQTHATAGTSTAASSNSKLPSEATVNEFLKHMFGYDQNLAWHVVSIKPSEAPAISEVTVVFNTPEGQGVQRIYVTPDEHYAFSGELVPFGADPFAQTRAELKNANGPAHGPKDAAVTIVEFGDLQCPACKNAQENLNKLMSEEPKAKLIFENFPLEQIHKWSLLGAKYVDCLGRENNDVVWKFIATTYDHQSEVNDQNAEEKLKEFVKASGGDPAAVSACVAKPETEKRVRDSLALGEKLNVNSTPTFFINGRKVAGFLNYPYEKVKAMVDYDMK